MREKQRRRIAMDLTSGPIWKQILIFALPLLASSFIQQLYNTVDLLFVGNLVGKEASAAVCSSSLLVACVVGFFTGVSVGAGVVTAQRVGAGDKAGVHHRWEGTKRHGLFRDGELYRQADRLVKSGSRHQGHHDQKASDVTRMFGAKDERKQKI